MAIPSKLGLRIEADRDRRPSIARLPTARAAFVGRTLRGPVNRAVLISSFAQFQHVFGGLWQPSPLGYSVEQFFDNGGQEAWIVRVANGARAATLSLPCGAGGEHLMLRAARPGTREFLRACVDYDNLPADDPHAFNLTVQRVRAQGAVHVEDQEIYRNLSVRPDAARYVADALAGSELVRAPSEVPARRPQCTIDERSGLATGYVHSNADGDDGAPVTDYDLIGSAAERTGMFALGEDQYFNFLCIPPIARDRDPGVSTLLVAARLCQERRALLIVDPPAGWHTADEALAGLAASAFASEHAAMYFPRILAYDKLRGRFETFAPCGAVAGMLARRDAQVPVWDDAGEAQGPVLRPGHKPACQVAEPQRAKLWSFGVNTLQSVRSATRRPLRPRTLASGGAAESRYLAPCRASRHIVNCIVRGTRWAGAADAGADAAVRVEAQVREFLNELHGAGAFADRAPEDAFFVVCDERLNRAGTAPDRPFRLLVGLPAPRIGEFHCHRISHAADRSEVAPVTLNRLHDLRFSPAEIEWADRIASRLER